MAGRQVALYVAWNRRAMAQSKPAGAASAAFEAVDISPRKAACFLRGELRRRSMNGTCVVCLACVLSEMTALDRGNDAFFRRLR